MSDEGKTDSCFLDDEDLDFNTHLELDERKSNADRRQFSYSDCGVVMPSAFDRRRKRERRQS